MTTMLAKDTFAGRVALVTGGGSGIGYEIARTLGRLGASVVIGSRRRDVIEQAADELRADGSEALAVPLDVREPDQVEAFMNAAETEYGRLDMLVNAAAGNFRVKAEDMSVNAWRAVVSIVLDGTWFCTQAAGRRMIAAGGGSILNVGTVGAFHGGPLAVHSASAKAGVLAMTRTLAVEWGAHNVRVNVVTPGSTNDTGAVTQLFPTDADRKRILRNVPRGRFAERIEIANAAAYLLSDYADFITGENLVIDGGRWLGRGHLEN
ncbi:SDR family oxidoreductase [Salinisphaera sp. T31B1]|uniref:SDR family oxidoreductase n=1 Tax=Salinisphaera sp. T31B1 TaxID=727963 RepID=UPI00334107C7